MKKICSIALAAALLLAGCTKPSSGAPEMSGAPAPDPSSPSARADKEMTTDVVVVGGGGAGISAAIAAAQQGRKVVLLEKVGYLGGATLMSGGLIPAVGTAQQIAAGIQDDLDWFVRDMMRPNNYSVRQDLVHTVAEQAKPTIEWMEDLGVQFSVVTGSLYYGQSNYRMHLAEGKGKGMTETMVRALEANGNITVLLQTPGTGLVTDDAGAVVGVYAQSPTDGKLLIRAENTVLATSGFAANREMVAAHIPEMAGAYPLVAPGATGEGILWGQALGAQVANMGAYQGHAFYSEEFGGSMDQGVMNRGGIFVNVNGVRFTNEYNGYSELSPHVLAQPTGHAFMVFPDAVAQQTASFTAYQEKDIVRTAATPRELAAQIGIDPDAFSRTVADYQASIRRGEDEFNRAKLPASFDGPYHAIRVTADLRHTQGGLVTDIAGHVLTTEGKLIKGLYAAGGVTEGFSSEGGAAYMSGNGLLQAVIFGRIAGERAATETRATAQVVEWQPVQPTAPLPSASSPAPAASEPSESRPEQAPASYQDGEYEGEGQGNNGPIRVKVTVADGNITSVEILSHNETPGIYESAEQATLDAVVANNGTGGVDTIAGATRSSEGILRAVDEALIQAR